MTDIQKMIEEEAEKHAENLHPLDKQKMVLHGKYYWKYHFKAGFNAGANFALSKQPEILFDFFIWFRENGEKYIDMSVEKMIEIYLKDKNNGCINNDQSRCDLCNGTGKAKYFDFAICSKCDKLSSEKTCSLYMKCKKATGVDNCPNCSDKSSCN